MKKIIFILLFAFVSASSLVSCTEEQVVPVKGDNGGTMPIDPVKR